MILGLSSSLPIGSLTLAHDGTAVGSLHWKRPVSHQEIFTLALHELLESSRVKKSELTGIVVDIGPGSFTGLRVGVNMARALAYALNIPVWPVHSLTLMGSLVRETLQSEPFYVAVDAQKNLYYVDYFLAAENHYSMSKRVPKLMSRELLFEEANKNNAQIVGAVKDSDKVTLPSLFPDPMSFCLALSAPKSSYPATTWQDLRPAYIKLSEPELQLFSKS